MLCPNVVVSECIDLEENGIGGFLAEAAVLVCINGLLRCYRAEKE